MSLSDGELDKRFMAAPDLDTGTEMAVAQVKEALYQAARTITQSGKDCRERSIALTKVEEARFWAVAAIARE